MQSGDFFLAFSPERIDPGSRSHTIRNTPKLVGGVDEASTTVAAALYRHIAEQVIPVSSPRIAEMAKVFENVFRSVNIALVNELAQLCEKMVLDVWEVIRAEATTASELERIKGAIESALGRFPDVSPIRW